MGQSLAGSPAGPETGKGTPADLPFARRVSGRNAMNSPAIIARLPQSWPQWSDSPTQRTEIIRPATGCTNTVRLVRFTSVSRITTYQNLQPLSTHTIARYNTTSPT